MKNALVFLLIGFSTFINSTCSAFAQLSTPFTQERKIIMSSIELNPYRFQFDDPSPRKGYAMEYLGFQLGYLGGAAVTSGLLVGGIISAWGGSREIAVPLLIGSGVTALGTPFLSAYLMKRFGKKYRPEGKYGIAVLGSYLGLGITAGASALMQYIVIGNNSYEDENFNFLMTANTINTFVMVLVPGLIAVLVYNLLPKSGSLNNSTSLLNIGQGSIRAGNPTFSLTPIPFSPGTHFTQFNLLSVRF